MKNLKKVLSLALAFAMVLGLCVTGMAAQDVTTLPDWDTVTDKDSAMLLNAFEIMQGDENGFRPNDDVKRSEAAKMISVALWGGKNNPELYANGNVGAYIDVVTGAWYMGYVNYLSVIGTVAGKGDGEFDPDGQVTGYELLKMCLVSLGYNAATEGLTGLGWDIKTMALATQRGYQDLTEGTTVTDWNAPLNRMNAATIIANMINRQMVAYNDGVVYGITYDHDDDADTPEIPHTFGTYVLGMSTKTGTLIANEQGVVTGHTFDKINTDADDYEGQNAVVLVDGKYEVVTLSSDVFDLGANVTVYLVDEGTDDEKIVSAAVASWNEISVKENTELATDDPNRYTNLEGTYAEYEAASHVFGTGGGAYSEGKTLDIDKDGKVDFSNTLNYGEPVKVTDVVEDSTYGTVYMLADKTWNVTRYESGKLEEGTDFVFAAKTTGEAVKGSMIITTTSANVFGGNWVNTYVLGEVEGKVTTFKDTTAWWTPFNIDGVPHFTTNFWENNPLGIKYGSEGIFYLDPAGSVILFSDPDETGADPTYAVIYEAGYEAWGSTTGLSGSNGVTVEVKAILEDGTNGTFEVNSVYFYGDDTTTVYLMKDQNGTTIKGTMTADDDKETDGLFSSKGALYSSWVDNGSDQEPIFVKYTLNNDGTIDLVFAQDNDDNAIGTTTTKVTGSTKTNNGYLTADTITFICVGDKWSVVKGTGLAEGDYTGTILTKAYLTSATQITYMVSATTDIETAAKATFFYVVANNGVSSANDDGDPLYEIVYFDADSNKIVTMETTTSVSADTYWTSLEDGAFSGKIEDWAIGFTTAVADGVIALSTAKCDGTAADTEVYDLDDDTVYFLVDGEETTEITLADLAEQDIEPGYKYNGVSYVYWQTMVVDNDTDDALDIVIVYADLQSRGRDGNASSGSRIPCPGVDCHD